MKLFASSQIRNIDAYTIANEPIKSIDLMERAANNIAEWIMGFASDNEKILVFSGPGNNGGDGVALTRILLDNGYKVKLILLKFTNNLSTNTQINIERLNEKYPESYSEISSLFSNELLQDCDIIVDAIFGSGLARPVTGFVAEVISKLNTAHKINIAIDAPSGLFGEDNSNNAGAIFKAHFTLSLQFPSISFFYAENNEYTGEVFVLPIGLHPHAIADTQSEYFLLEEDSVESIVKRRSKFSHKGIFGHALLVAGSYGKMGAAVLAAKACLRTGAGLLTTHIPVRGCDIIQTAVPENMLSIDDSEFIFTNVDNIENYDAIGVGPGLGCKLNTMKGLENILINYKENIVLDADALNIIAKKPELFNLIPSNTILTPHPKEFERLFGKTNNSFNRMKLQQKWSSKLNSIIICKGAHTIITSPDGRIFFNNTGNPGMATAGSGDVLTGMILSLLAQKYLPLDAAILGVYLHGLAGDCALKNQSEESLISGDIIDTIGEAFNKLNE
jgi:ADP-dependent NAD(P)H-hydrate dehydratase / NAD(P)H-hydrate epimerase